MSIRNIPQAELKVMKFIWEKNDTVTSKETIEAMGQKYGWKQTTTLTLLSRLVKKHFLHSERIKRLTYYKIVVTKKVYLKVATRRFLEEIHSNSIESLISSLEDCGTIDKKT
ncbi:BlaI/MecI/CopY family transcriptional regulator [Clostridioides difficile]|nr:BlaI/MecI/CopY family transcriptional regulator [Clostridioides difficile]